MAPDAPRLGGELAAAGCRHLHIGQQGRYLSLLLENAQGITGRGAGDGAAAQFFEHAGGEVEDHGIIVDNENNGRHHKSHALRACTPASQLSDLGVVPAIRGGAIDDGREKQHQQRMPTVRIAALSSSDVYGLLTMAIEAIPLKASRISVAPWPVAITIGSDG